MFSRAKLFNPKAFTFRLCGHGEAGIKTIKAFVKNVLRELQSSLSTSVVNYIPLKTKFHRSKGRK